MGMQAWHELLQNRGACGADRGQPTANGRKPTAKGKEIKS
jgi:hypothetical protein